MMKNCCFSLLLPNAFFVFSYKAQSCVKIIRPKERKREKKAYVKVTKSSFSRSKVHISHPNTYVLNGRTAAADVVHAWLTFLVCTYYCFYVILLIETSIKRRALFFNPPQQRTTRVRPAFIIDPSRWVTDVEDWKPFKGSLDNRMR